MELPFKTLAFIAATLLSPYSRTARDVAARIGLKGRAAIRRLVKQAVANGHIAAVEAKGGWIVARPGVDLSAFQVGERNVENEPVKNGPVENGPVENGPTHSKMKERHREKKGMHITKRVVTQSEETDSFFTESVEVVGGHHSLGRGPAEELIADLRSADHAQALARYLLTPTGIEPLLAMMRQHGGKVVRAAVVDKLIGFAMGEVDSGKLRTGEVTTWNYFQGAIDDERHRAWMEENRLRPGDIGKRHRRAALQPAKES
jgi:hypothetical protein